MSRNVCTSSRKQPVLNTIKLRRVTTKAWNRSRTSSLITPSPRSLSQQGSVSLSACSSAGYMTDEGSYGTAAEKKRQRQGSGIPARSQSFRPLCQTDRPHPDATTGVAIVDGALSLMVPYIPGYTRNYREKSSFEIRVYRILCNTFFPENMLSFRRFTEL